MILLAKKLYGAQTQADREEFVRGLTQFDSKPGKKNFLVGVVAGYVLTAKAKKK